jgi:hypothetical protein
MKLTGKVDLEAPIAHVYAQFADHPAWEREARQRGIEVERPEGMPATGVGAGWRLWVPFRGGVRRVLLTMAEMTPHHRIAMTLDGQTIEGEMVLELLALSPTSTRLRLVVDVSPKTLAARLFLNTLRLAKGRVQARLDERLAGFGARIVHSYRQTLAASGGR